MRSQATKPLPKKGALSKTTFKANSSTKQTKKKSVCPKKVKNILNKALVKSPKKSTSKDDVTNSKNDGDLSTGENEPTSETKAGPSKSNSPRSDSPAKKSKKEPKKKEDPLKNNPENNVKKIATKKVLKVTKKVKSVKPNIKASETENDDVKYKINVEVVKKNTSKYSKAKTIIKKGNVVNQKKKNSSHLKQENLEKEEKKEDNDSIKSVCTKVDSEQTVNDKNMISEIKQEKLIDTISEEKVEIKDTGINSTSIKNTSNVTSPILSETPKTETERPPKFFTSTRSPRTVDIDVKCFKNSKGNLSMSERFLSMKFETKSEDNSKDKNISNTLVSQGPEIDVYTFTEKVDSPKSILSDFRSPINKNVGRVRPIARVKGTVIDRKTDSDKKKYSPHRPIEEVVKQLKANKRSEELNPTPNQTITSNVETNIISDEKELEDNPKPIVSKSYKMVARKSSITGKPFSPTKFLEQDQSSNKNEKPVKTTGLKKSTGKSKKQQKKIILSDDEIESSKFALNTKSPQYTSSDESISESNDDNDTKESCESDTPKSKKTKTKKYKKTTDSGKKSTSKELKELSKDSHCDLKDQSILLGEKPSKRRLKLLSMWTGPKKHRMASLNAIAKVHCLYENESRTHMELGLMKTVDRQITPSTSKPIGIKKKETKPKEIVNQESTSESEYENRKEKKESSESSDDIPPQRSLRGVPGIRSAGKYWDPKSSTSSSEDSELETKKKPISPEKKKTAVKSPVKSDSEKPLVKMKKTVGVPVKKKRNRNELVMDLKDMVVQKRMASLNATAILAASYEKRSPKSSKDDSTSDTCSDESFSQKPKNVTSSGVKSETKMEDTKKEVDESSAADRKQKVEVIVNQDTDVTITGVYSTHHEGFCTAMQYRISSTSHTQTTATANCEKEGCSRDDNARYTPLSALSSMQPPAEHSHPHPHPGKLSELRRAAGCSSAFSAPSPSAHHEPGYYQPAGPLIKESGAEAERALARYHPPPHYHARHPPVLQQYGPPYYPAELCYSPYYRSPGPYHIPPPQPDAQMVGVGNEPYPPPQYYGTPPCYQHSPQRIPYVEYRQCTCPLNTCPKNVLIGPATGKAPTGGGPADVPTAHAPPGGAFRPKVRACALDAGAVPDTLAHGSGKDPPLEAEPPAAADAPRPCPLPAIGGASPKRELYDARDKLRRAGDMPALGPPSPARGSAGVCAPQPPPVPRRARLGKEMARRSLAGDDTGLLLTAPLAPTAGHSDADDDVLAISPPVCVPIDLSSSDERSTPLVDVKKENEGPTNAPPRKPDAQALREHNCTAIADAIDNNDAAKAVKRRYSKPKLEIDMKDTQLEDGCKTNGIGEHVKLQKRRKVSGEQADARPETVTKEPRKRALPTKRMSKSSSVEKKSLKRKLDNTPSEPRAKKPQVECLNEDPRLKNVAAVAEEPVLIKPKTKSALLLDKLMRKNSIDRADAKGYASDTELNPAELFLSPNENIAQNCTKKTLNINNNVVENNNAVNGVRPNTIAAVSQLVAKKLPCKSSCKVDKIDSKITHKITSVLKTGKLQQKDEQKALPNKEKQTYKSSAKTPSDKSDPTPSSDTSSRKDNEHPTVSEKCSKITKLSKPTKTRTETVTRVPEIDEPVEAQPAVEVTEKRGSDGPERSVEASESIQMDEAKPERPSKRCKLSVEQKGKNVEKVVKLLVSKRPAIKTDDAVLVTEDACSSPAPGGPSGVGGPGRRARRRRPRARRPAAPSRRPRSRRAPPRWSNGWSFDGEHYVSKVYLNNDSRLDRPARCWSRMSHASGDRVSRGDCVLLRASVARAQPFVARVASLWENPDDGEMMVSLVWYYRPEHTEHGRQPADAPDEVFASRHRDANSVACIEDKCYVLRYNEYCRYRKRLKAAEEGITLPSSIVPPMPASEVSSALAPNDSKLPLTVSPELVLFCRKVYDFRSKKIYVPNK
ncbi:LOW QUALITY PROTEIN: uncharacterized protein ACR2FA_004373 [Aphomia sociella]